MALIDDILLKDIALINDMQRAPDGDLQSITGLRNIKQALYRRLLATPGTLVHRPDYGVGVKNYLNSVNSLNNQRSLALRVKEQFERDPRVKEVVGLRFEQDEVIPGKFTIFVKVRVAGFDEAELGFGVFGGTV